MYNPFGGNKFPYSNFHELNLDWIIEIAKNFLDQYSHIQEIIENGEQSIQDKTTEGMEALEAKATEIETALDAWYTEHSQDISDELDSAIVAFRNQVNTYVAQVIASIPADYSALAASVQNLENIVNKNKYDFTAKGSKFNMLDPNTAHDYGYYNDQGTVVPYSNYVYYDQFEINPNEHYSFLGCLTPGEYEFRTVYAAAIDAEGTVTEYINGQAIQNKQFTGAKYIALSTYGTVSTLQAIFMKSENATYIGSKVILPFKKSPSADIDLSDNTTLRSSWIRNSNLFNNEPVLAIQRIGNIHGCPENSIVGFKEAMNAGFNTILADLLWTSDGVPVCCHDNNIVRVARNSDGTSTGNVYISSTTYNDLLTYDFGLAFGQQYKGTKILRLADLLMFVKLTGMKLWLEFKNFDSPNYSIANTVSMAYNYGIEKNITWYGGLAAIRTVHNVDPSAAISYLANQGEISDENFTTLLTYKNNNDLSILGWPETTLTPGQKEQMKQNGIKFGVGTLDTKTDIRDYINQNPFCTMIESNEIPAYVPMIEQVYSY